MGARGRQGTYEARTALEREPRLSGPWLDSSPSAILHAIYITVGYGGSVRARHPEVHAPVAGAANVWRVNRQQLDKKTERGREPIAAPRHAKREDL